MVSDYKHAKKSETLEYLLGAKFGQTEILITGKMLVVVKAKSVGKQNFKIWLA